MTSSSTPDALVAGYIVTANDRIFGVGATPDAARADALHWLEQEDRRGDEDISLLDGCSTYPATTALLAQVRENGTPEQWGRLPQRIYSQALEEWTHLHCTLGEQEEAEATAETASEAAQKHLVAAGQALYGDEWISPLARGLAVAVRTVQRWASGEVTVPDRVLEAELPKLARAAVEDGLAAALEERAAMVRTLAYPVRNDSASAKGAVDMTMSRDQFETAVSQVKPATIAAYVKQRPHLGILAEKMQRGNLLAAREFSRAALNGFCPPGVTPMQLWDLSKLIPGFR